MRPLVSCFAINFSLSKLSFVSENIFRFFAACFDLKR